jgi:Na+-translocating ferredoxin:NAD+ oxidoreductase RnfD subunit
MSAPAAPAGRPTVRIRGTTYPVLLPTWRDPRLHLAAVIISLQILGQTAFDFRLSIAQILVSLVTCAVLEVGIGMWRQHVLMWPASALLTGNGVAFILRVPGTEHGDWWSMHGWWIFAGTAAVSLLSKHLIHLRGRHIFNPSNVGLVLCFLLLGPERADPLAFWWGPMSFWLAVALVLIVGGGLAILLRLKLLSIAVGFWVTFAAALAVLAASGHEMTAAWHLGPVTDWEFWRILVFSPEILVFLFFMITDPKTIPSGRSGRLAYAVSIGLLATLLIAPQDDEFGTKVAVLASLTIVCAAWPLLALLRRPAAVRVGRAALGGAALVGAVGFAGLLVVAGAPARSSTSETALPEAPVNELVSVTIAASSAGLQPLDRRSADRIAADVAADLRVEAEALRRRDRARASAAADGERLASLWRQIAAAKGGPIAVPHYRVHKVRVWLEPGGGQAPPVVVAKVTGTVERATYAGGDAVSRAPRRPFSGTFELVQSRGRYLIVRARGAAAPVVPAPQAVSEALGGVRLQDVAHQVGLDFRHGAFNVGVSDDEPAMMGGGLCWLDADEDGWLDLYVVNSYSEDELAHWDAKGARPRAALFRNVRGRFEDVSRGSGADLVLRGSGCVAGDFDLDGHTDLYVTTTGYNVATDGYDALLWGHGDGTFTEGARAAGVTAAGWHAGATVGDVNGDGRPDLFVAGYTDLNAALPASTEGFPGNHRGVRDLLYLNEGGRRFREVGAQAGIEGGPLEHGLGAVLTDANRDGRLDLYVANDGDPNRLYLNVARPGSPLGFRFEERGSQEGVADANAGMGIAAGDFSLDGREDLFVSNSRRQLHAVYRSGATRAGSLFADARPDLAGGLGTRYTGWGVSWADLDLDGDLDLVLANGAIPVTSLARNADRVQVLAQRDSGEFANARALDGAAANRRLNGRGLAAADYDNDGDLDVAVNAVGGRLMLLRNAGAKGHWLEVELPRFAPGTTVTAELPTGRRLVRTAHAGGSYLSSEDPRLHFGLGDAKLVRELTIRFPGGRVARLANVAANRLVAAP